MWFGVMVGFVPVLSASAAELVVRGAWMTQVLGLKGGGVPAAPVPNRIPPANEAILVDITPSRGNIAGWQLALRRDDLRIDPTVQLFAHVAQEGTGTGKLEYDPNHWVEIGPGNSYIVSGWGSRRGLTVELRATGRPRGTAPGQLPRVAGDITCELVER